MDIVKTLIGTLIIGVIIYLVKSKQTKKKQEKALEIEAYGQKLIEKQKEEFYNTKKGFIPPYNPEIFKR